jgi:hypothetical protein
MMMKSGIVELNQKEIDGVSGAPIGFIIKTVAKLLTKGTTKESAKKAVAVEVAYEGAAPSTPQE